MTSIINPKYIDKYKVKEKGWFEKFVDSQVQKPVTKLRVVKTKAEDGTETVTEQEIELKRKTLDLDALFKLSQINKINTSEMEAQVDRKNAPGRIRMTLGNQLRAAAKRRGGLYDLHNDWVDADEVFFATCKITEDRDGNKLNKADDAPAPEAEAA